MTSLIIEKLVKGIHSLAEAIAKADRGDQEDAAATATVTQIVLNSVMRSPTATTSADDSEMRSPTATTSADDSEMRSPTATTSANDSEMRSPTETPTETEIELTQLKALKDEFLKGFQARGYRYRSIESLAEETGIATEIVKSFVTNDWAFRRSTGSKSVFTMRQFD